MRIAIIGNGIAGINVASALRGTSKNLPEDQLTIEVYAAETHPLYSRVRLPDVVAGRNSPEDIVFYKPEWYEKRGIHVYTGFPVESIDRAKRVLYLSNGHAVSWDYLVLATGASANRPPISGVDQKGIFTLRTMENALSIRKYLAEYPGNASVIGGGLLGLEAARALKDAGTKNVRVFEIFPRLLPRQLDETGADLLMQRFSAMGIEVVCSAETAGFEPVKDSSGEAERAGKIRLKDGRVFNSDLTILSMGVHSNTELAVAAGIQVHRGIVVDNHMRTSDSHIFAVGDCAEFDGIVWGIIPAALEQAPIAAKNILADCGIVQEPQIYTQTVPQTALKIAGIELLSLGKAVLTPEEAASGNYTIMSHIWENTEASLIRYEKFVLVPAAQPDQTTEYSGSLKLVGAVLYGSKKHQSTVRNMMGKTVTNAEVDALLAD